MQVKQQQVESAEQHNASMNILHGAVKYAESWEEPGNESLVPWDHGGAGQALGPERPGWILAPWLWGHLGESSSSQSLNPLICKMKTKTLGKAGVGVWALLIKWGVPDDLYHHPDEMRTRATSQCFETQVSAQNSTCPKGRSYLSKEQPSADHAASARPRGKCQGGVSAKHGYLQTCRHCCVLLTRVCKTESE